MSKNYKLFHGDCLNILDSLIKQKVKVHAVIADPPYGTTKCKWDSTINFNKLWNLLKLIRNNNCPIVLFNQEPFGSLLRCSNLNEYKYDWIWEKNICPNFMMAKYVPLKKTENISVFSNCGVNTNCKSKMNYYPQGLIDCNKNIDSNCPKSGVNIYNCLNKKYIQTKTNYPTNILHFKSEKGFHPTQKPVALMEYLIKTYTNENEIVLDFCMGSGTTGVACKHLNRKFIGIEIKEEYFKIAENRLKSE